VIDIRTMDRDRALEALIAIWREQGTLAEDNLERGRGAASASGERLDRALSKLGLVSDAAFAAGWSAVTAWPLVEAWPSEPISVPGVPDRFLVRSGLVPLGIEDRILRLAVADPLDAFSLAAVSAKTGLTVAPHIAKPAELQAALEKIDAASGAVAGLDESFGGLASDVDRLRDLASEAPAIRAIETMIERAVDIGASDIHVLPTVNGGRVRIRVDGVLRDIASWTRDLTATVTSRLKVMAGLDIAEARLPQDGRLRVPHRGVELDLRVATIPHVHGEGVVLRVLHRARATPDLGSLALSPEVLAGLERVIAASNGLLLVTGPTGSGKTTTLYATLQRLARPDRNIITVEDPVEHTLDGAAQVQIDRRIGFDFAQALRSVLRHDPDVVMIGEIRDGETAAIAVRAALTGHLVLATVHTNSAIAAVPRLVDMGVEPWLLASTLRGAMAQRLLRRLCPSCRVTSAAQYDQFLHLAGARALRCEAVFEPAGCPQCSGTGYRGRIAVGEFVAAAPALVAAIGERANGQALEEAAPPYLHLLDDALRRVVAGETSLSEVTRVLGDTIVEGRA